MGKRGRPKKAVETDKKAGVVENIETTESKTIEGPLGVAERFPQDAAKVALDVNKPKGEPIKAPTVAIFEGTGFSILTLEENGKKMRVSMDFASNGGQFATTNLERAKLIEAAGIKRIQ